MNEVIENLMSEYEERFDDQFPLMMMQSATDEEIEESLRQCLESNTPFSYDDEVVY